MNENENKDVKLPCAERKARIKATRRCWATSQKKNAFVSSFLTLIHSSKTQKQNIIIFNLNSISLISFWILLLFLIFLVWIQFLFVFYVSIVRSSSLRSPKITKNKIEKKEIKMRLSQCIYSFHLSIIYLSIRNKRKTNHKFIHDLISCCFLLTFCDRMMWK